MKDGQLGAGDARSANGMQAKSSSPFLFGGDRERVPARRIGQYTSVKKKQHMVSLWVPKDRSGELERPAQRKREG